MRNLLSEIFQFSSILTLTSTHHVTLTMNGLKNIFIVSIIHQTDIEILFSPDFFQILLITDTNYMLIRC